MTNFPESDVQFLARCLIAVREGDQMNAKDAHRLDQLANLGHTHQQTTTMPEGRASGERVPGPSTPAERIED